MCVRNLEPHTEREGLACLAFALSVEPTDVPTTKATAMSVTSPHYLLLSEARHAANQDNAWRFVLENMNSLQRLTAADREPHTGGERLELLAVVRGLEAIDCPARVTLITKSRYVNRGLKYGMNEWRAKNWQWERFGKLVPVRDHDLWQRVDRALQFHQVQCRAWQFASGVEHDDEATRQNQSALPMQPTCVSGLTACASKQAAWLANQTKEESKENCAVLDSRKECRQVLKRRIDPSHLSQPGTHLPVDLRTQPNRPPSSRKAPPKKTLSQGKRLDRRSQSMVARLKWSLYAWLSRLLSNAQLTDTLLTDTLFSDTRLSEHRLQPLS